MPTYDYQCSACGHEFQRFQSMTAKVQRKCPECAKPALKRLIGPGAGFLFKGSGFYITDYRSESYKTAEKSDAAPSSEPAKPAASSDQPAASSGSQPAKAKAKAKPKES